MAKHLILGTVMSDNINDIKSVINVTGNNLYIFLSSGEL